MTSETHQTQDPERRRRGDAQLFWWSAGGTLVFLLGVLFLPWDAPMPEAPDLEFTPPAIPAADNAFTYFEEAARLQVTKFPPFYKSEISSTPGMGIREWYWSDLLERGGVWDQKVADGVLAANTAALAAAEQGLACQHYASPPMDFSTPMYWLGKNKSTVEILCLKSRRAQLAGDNAEAVRVGLLGLRMGRMMAENNDCDLEWMRGVSCQLTSLVRLEEVASDPATPEPVLRELLAALDRWDPQEVVRGFQRSLQNEYVIHRNAVAAHDRDWPFYRNTKFPSDINEAIERLPYARKPKATLQLLVPCYRILIDAADKPFSVAKANYPILPREPEGKLEHLWFYAHPNGFGREFFAKFKWREGIDFFGIKCRLQAWVAALRLKTALRLYEAKHGRLPEELGALVPDYLPAIPTDPYDGQPFRYSRAEKKVWSVGRDLKDQGGHPPSRPRLPHHDQYVQQLRPGHAHWDPRHEATAPATAGQAKGEIAMDEHDSQTEATLRRRRGSAQLFWWSAGGTLVFLLGVLFLPWDAPMPKTPSDLEFTTPNIPKAENAFTYFKAAEELSSTDFKNADGKFWTEVLVARIGWPSEAWDPKFADEVLDANAAVFVELEKGLACRHYASPAVSAFEESLPWLSYQKWLTLLLGLRSKRAQLAGDYPEAARANLQALRLGMLVAAGSGSLEESLYATNGLARRALDRMDELADDLKTPEPVLRELQQGLDAWEQAGVDDGYRQSLRNDYGRCCRLSAAELKAWIPRLSGQDWPRALAFRLPYARKPGLSRADLVPCFRNAIANVGQPMSSARPIDLSPFRPPTASLSRLAFLARPNGFGKEILGNRL